MAEKGDELTFIGVAGVRWRARLVTLHPTSGCCSIEVDVGTKETFPLTMVKWRERPTNETFVAWPRESDGAAQAT